MGCLRFSRTIFGSFVRCYFLKRFNARLCKILRGQKSVGFCPILSKGGAMIDKKGSRYFSHRVHRELRDSLISVAKNSFRKQENTYLPLSTLIFCNGGVPLSGLSSSAMRVPGFHCWTSQTVPPSGDSCFRFSKNGGKGYCRGMVGRIPAIFLAGWIYRGGRRVRGGNSETKCFSARMAGLWGGLVGGYPIRMLTTSASMAPRTRSVATQTLLRLSGIAVRCLVPRVGCCRKTRC